MLLSLALILFCAMALSALFQRCHLPGLLGMLLAGMLLGPHLLNWLDPSLLSISLPLRQIALIIILTRAGLGLDISQLKSVGRPALLLCFLPACVEIFGMVLLAPVLLGVTPLEGAILGAVVAAVSPAVIVPRMLFLIEGGYGTKKGIPQMLMAGASVDDVFVIVLFTAFTGLARGANPTPAHLLAIPSSILLGLFGGLLAGLALTAFFSKMHLRDSKKVVILLSLAFLLVTVEGAFSGVIGFSGLLAVMAVGVTLRQKNPPLAQRLSVKFSKLWIFAELLLFALVGATVDLSYVKQAGLLSVFLLLAVLLFRGAGVLLCLIKTPLNRRERLYCVFSYLPKATVQAAIGGLPLAMGLPCGQLVLTVAVLSILLTAPLGAILMDATYPRLLERDSP